MSDDHSYEDRGFAPEDELADDGLAESTITSVRHVMQQQGVSELFYQNFMMLEQDDGGYVVADKMTGEVLLRSNEEKDLSVNNISPYAAEVLLDACLERDETPSLDDMIQKGLEYMLEQGQAEILAGAEGFAILVEEPGTQIPLVDKDVDFDNISPYARGVLLSACVERNDAIRQENSLRAVQSQPENSEGFAVIIENPISEIPIVDFEADGPGIEEDIEL